jgi:hypothetical protein
MEDAPARFTIRPDDYHVPYAGTAEDGRRFFLTEELFSDTSAWVGLFLWKADGQFDEVRVSAVGRAPGLPPGQAAPADSDRLVQARLAELGKHVLEPITVEPTAQSSDGRSTATPTARTSSASSPATSSATTRPGTVTTTTPDSTSPQPHLCREAVTSRPPATMTVRPRTRSCRRPDRACSGRSRPRPQP